MSQKIHVVRNRTMQIIITKPTALCNDLLHKNLHSALCMELDFFINRDSSKSALLYISALCNDKKNFSLVLEPINVIALRFFALFYPLGSAIWLVMFAYRQLYSNMLWWDSGCYSNFKRGESIHRKFVLVWIQLVDFSDSFIAGEARTKKFWRTPKASIYR